MTDTLRRMLFCFALGLAACGGSSTPPPTPAALAGDDADGIHDFGAIDAATTSAAQVWTLTNTGGSATGTLSVSASGANTADFPFTTTCSGTLAPSGSCTVSVSFGPTSPGSRDATLSVAASPGGTLTLQVFGTGRTAAALADDGGGSHDFGLVRAAVGFSPTLVWTISNSGQSTSGTPTVTRSGAQASEFIYSTTCTAPLASGGTCTVSIAFTPATIGLGKTASFSVAATPGGAVTLSAAGIGGLVLQAYKTGAGTGTVTTAALGINCGADCTEVYAPGTYVTLQARTTNGSGSYFQGWSGACSGSGRDCAAVLTTDADVTANFATMTNNLVFVTSGAVPANRGSAAAYDVDCNDAATAAGINSGTGNAYRAWVSDASSTAVSRLGAARGWRLLDGRPVTDTLTGLTANGVLWNPISVDENGVRQVGGYVLTGTLPNGTADTAETCTAWTSLTGNVHVGERGAGPSAWTDSGFSNCNGSYRLYCFMSTSTAALAAPTYATGKRMWVTTSNGSPSGGIAAMNTLCGTEKPTGVASATALVATSTAAASDKLSSAESYVTVSGQLIATGADLKADALPLLTGPWQRNDGTFTSTVVMTGSTAVNVVGGYTCTDWSVTTGTYARGIINRLDYRWFRLNTTYACTTGAPILCIEQ